ncbi:Hypothetical protein NGAL_HAMBI2427_31230 [Neorhizobium galegae bv. orientalis]|nr:Hypothetical protein NGAL_HAMBI2427_31230 [Neorhizobium galegae bv. orientalis]
MAKTDHTSILRYDLALDNDARRGLEEAFAAYATMLSMLDELVSEKAGANLVTLHELAYETVRDRTGLPARLVTLGLRDFASNRGRVAVPYDVAGYSRGTLNISMPSWWPMAAAIRSISRIEIPSVTLLHPEITAPFPV